MSRVSVIIPVYNVEQYIEKCILSVLSQTYRHFEIIVVNDKTLDQSIELANAILSKQVEIPYQIIHMPENSGISAARNTGIEAAKGDHLLFIDSDDWIEPEMLQKLVGASEQQNADMVFCRVRQVYEQSDRFEVLKSLPEGLWNKQESLLRLFKGDYPTHIYKILISKSLFDGIRFPIGIVYEDVLTLPYLLDNANTIYFIDDVLYNYLQRPGSLTKSYNAKLEGVVREFTAMDRYFQDRLTDKKLKIAYRRYVYLTYHVIACHAIYFSPDSEQLNQILRNCCNAVSYRTIFRLLASHPSKTIAHLLVLKLNRQWFQKLYS
ncbi:glycosyltransferase family 2 protein [Parapedobacter sp. DT-150]|uniref:glycosyltransferase family 2 protein n=1 Tax=Parapedobacter sp. DT-150 TaxID=3396162 RepID=UPI003F1BE992